MHKPRKNKMYDSRTEKSSKQNKTIKNYTFERDENFIYIYIHNEDNKHQTDI